MIERHFYFLVVVGANTAGFFRLIKTFNRKLKKAFLHCRFNSADGLLRWSDGWFGAACFCLGKIAEETTFSFIDTGFHVSHAG
jgi:hypothetical protein